MKKELFAVILSIVAFSAYGRTVLDYHIQLSYLYGSKEAVSLADTTLDPETHLTLDILSRLPIGQPIQVLEKFFDTNKVVYYKLFNENITLKNPDLEYFIVDGVSYTFSKFDFKDISLENLERLALIKDGKYTISDHRSLRNKEKQEYDALTKAIAERLKAKFGPPSNGYFKCSQNVKCSVVLGNSKTYDGDDIIAIYLTFEALK